MSQEIEGQQRLTLELREQLRSLEDERVRITEQIQVLEVKLEVQELRDQVTMKTEVVKRLRARKQELEGKLRLSEETPAQTQAPEEQVQLASSQEESSRSHF